MKLRPFELALVLIFAGLGLAAMIILSVADFSNSDAVDPASQIGVVSIWGTLPSEPMDQVLRTLRAQDELYANVSYRYVAEPDFNTTLVNALADGTGPDLLLMPHEFLVEQRRRLQPISYESYPLRDYSSIFIDGAELFALQDGIYGLPVMVDPLMLYWNKDIVTNAGYLTAPRTWEELVSVQFPSLITRGVDRSVSRSVVALGEYKNVRNAFGIFSSLLIQSGSDKVVETTAGEYSVRLNNISGTEREPMRTSLDFYLRFNQPSNTLYSWNRSFTEDRLQFIGEDLVFYFGYGSEGKEIEKLNPNLNFDIAEMPQSAAATVRRTFGRFYTMVPLRSADNLNGAFTVLSTLTSTNVSRELATAYNMVPTRREAVALGSNDLYGRLAYQSAPIAFAWLSPDYLATQDIFATMMSNVSENRSTQDSAVNDALTNLRSEY